MQIDTTKLKKRYYSIGEVAELYNVSSSLIRYWENEFPSLKPHKNSKGDRRFTPDNLEELNSIYHLVKERGFTLDGARTELELMDEKKRKKSDILKSIRKVRGKLQKLKNRFEEE
jgi:DNA-binding transcriptional MerR regulator